MSHLARHFIGLIPCLSFSPVTRLTNVSHMPAFLSFKSFRLNTLTIRQNWVQSPYPFRNCKPAISPHQPDLIRKQTAGGRNGSGKVPNKDGTAGLARKDTPGPS